MRRGIYNVLIALTCASCASTGASKGSLIRANPIATSADHKVETRIEERQRSLIAKPMKIAAAKPGVKASASPDEVLRKANEEALRRPDSEGFFNSAMLFDWEPNALYQIYAAPLRVTDVSLEPMERIISLSGGDTTRWQVAQTTSGSGQGETPHIIIKPFRSQIKTNLVIMTDRRTYHLEIHSLDDGNYMASASWNYPQPLVVTATSKEEEEESVNPLERFTPEQLDFRYHFVTSKKPIWMPSRVFDDGRKTYIEFPRAVRAREMPALFVLSKNGDSEIINYRTVDNFYVIDRLVDVIELRLGAETPEVVGIEKI